MALTDTKDFPARRHTLRMPERVQAWLASDHGAAQRLAGFAFVIRVASAAIVFISQIALARWMGSTEYGTYVYVCTWLLGVSELVHLALPLTAQRYIPEYTQRNALDLLRGFLTGSRWLAFGTATAVAVAGAVLVRTFVADPHAVMPLYLVCVALPFYSFSFLLDGLSRSYNWMGLALIPHAILRPLVLLMLLAILHLAGAEVDATTAMLAMTLSIWSTSLLQLALLSRRLGKVVPRGPRTYDFKAWLWTSIPMMMMWGFYTLLTYTDVLVLQQFRGPDEVAHYYAAAKTLALVSFVQFAVAGATAHRFSAYHVAGDREGLANFATSTVRWIFWPSLAAILIILALGKPMLWLFGPTFVDGAQFMFILAFGFMARAAVGPAERLLNMVGEQKACAMAYATAFAFNLVGCVALAGRYGAVGVAVATSAAYTVEATLLFMIAKRRLGLHMLIWRPRQKT